MPWREKFEIGGIYHLYNRGVKKEKIFLGDRDYSRFLEVLDEFNWERNLKLREIREIKKCSPLPSQPIIEKGKRLVEILCFCLMDNHFHLLVRQVSENGITCFMRKVSSGYAHYFNKKHEKSGHVFQGRFKSVRVVSDAQLIHLTEYIHLNPLKLIPSKNGLSKINDRLKLYKWSSYHDFVGDYSYPDICKPEIITDFAGGVKGYKESLSAWARRKNLKELKEKAF